MKFKAHNSYITTLAIDPQNHYMISGSIDGEIHAWSLPEAQLKTVIRHSHSTGRIDWLAFSPDGTLLAYALNYSLLKGRVELRETYQWALVNAVDCKEVFDLAWSPEGDILAVATNNILVLKEPSYVETKRLIDIEGRTHCVRFSKSGDLLIAAGDYYDPSIAFWNPKTLQLISKDEGCLFNPSHFLYASDDILVIQEMNDVYEYSLSQQSLKFLRTEGESVFPPILAISPDMRYLARGTNDDFENISLQIKALKTGEVIHKVEGLQYGIRCLQFWGNDKIIFADDAGYITIEQFTNS
jgi:WD40 repeat protein